MEKWTFLKSPFSPTTSIVPSTSVGMRFSLDVLLSAYPRGFSSFSFPLKNRGETESIFASAVRKRFIFKRVWSFKVPLLCLYFARGFFRQTPSPPAIIQSSSKAISSSRDVSQVCFSTAQEKGSLPESAVRT